jgi:hypothetical protein
MKQELIIEAMREAKVALRTAQDQIDLIQEICYHPDVVKTHKSNTGNYDPHADCYWTEFKCPDCGKWWSEVGSK